MRGPMSRIQAELAQEASVIAACSVSYCASRLARKH
jgi:hypothetical protein